MKMLLLFPLMLTTSVFAGETILSDEIVKVGTCVYDDLKSGKTTKPENIYWIVFDSSGLVVGMEYPKFPGDRFRMNTNDRIYQQRGGPGGDVFLSVYKLQVNHKIKKETFERNMLLQKKAGTEKIVNTNTVETKSFEGEAPVKGRDEIDLRAQKNISNFTAKEKCEATRAKLLNKVAKVSNPAINDSDRGNTKADIGIAIDTPPKPARKATRQ